MHRAIAMGVWARLLLWSLFLVVLIIACLWVQLALRRARRAHAGLVGEGALYDAPLSIGNPKTGIANAEAGTIPQSHAPA